MRRQSSSSKGRPAICTPIGSTVPVDHPDGEQVNSRLGTHLSRARPDARTTGRGHENLEVVSLAARSRQERHHGRTSDETRRLLWDWRERAAPRSVESRSRGRPPKGRGKAARIAVRRHRRLPADARRKARDAAVHRRVRTRREEPRVRPTRGRRVRLRARGYFHPARFRAETPSSSTRATACIFPPICPIPTRIRQSGSRACSASSHLLMCSDRGAAIDAAQCVRGDRRIEPGRRDRGSPHAGPHLHPRRRRPRLARRAARRSARRRPEAARASPTTTLELGPGRRRGLSRHQPPPLGALRAATRCAS